MKKTIMILILAFALLSSLACAFDSDNNLGYWSHDDVDTTGVISIDMGLYQ